jgi:hypothetical protein
MPALQNIPTDTRYLAIEGVPLTQAAVEQLERNWTGQDLSGAQWLGRVVISHGVGESRYSHDVAIGYVTDRLEGKGHFKSLVAFRIAEAIDQKARMELRALPFGLLMM